MSSPSVIVRVEPNLTQLFPSTEICASVRYQSRPSTQAAGSSSTIGQPVESTSVPAGVFGHWSRSSVTPSPSESTGTGQPMESTRVPGGVFGQRSMSSVTPSPSLSAGGGGSDGPPPKKKEMPPCSANVLVASLSVSRSTRSNSSIQMMLSRPSIVSPHVGSSTLFTNLNPRKTGTSRSVKLSSSPS